MNLILYYTPRSSSSRVHWALEELEITYEARRVNLAEGEQRRPEFLTINPNGKVPALVIDGRPIFESLAMLIFLGENYGVQKGLYPAEGVSRAEALKWMVWGDVTLGDALWTFARNTMARVPAEQRNAAAAEKGRLEFIRLAEILEAELRDKEFLLGGGFSFADLAVASLASLAPRFGLSLEAFPKIQSWIGRCESRPAYGRMPQS